VKLAAVMLARTLAFVETADLNPRGRIFYPELVSDIVQRYKFQVFPQSLEQFDEQKGVEFRAGRLGKIVIETLKIFNMLLVVETRSSTEDSKRIIQDMLEWGKEKFALTYEPEMVKRWAYVSNVTFYSDVPLISGGSDPISKLANKVSNAVSETWQEAVDYEPMFLAIGHDPLVRRNGIAAFTIQRRADCNFSENKYFSEAPLSTDMHLDVLQQFEADLKDRVAENKPLRRSKRSRS
jgi:hypothetical protein